MSVRLDMERLKDANAELVRRVDSPDNDYPGVFLCRASKERFLAYCEKEPELPVKLVFKEGGIFAVDFPSSIHSAIAGEITGAFYIVGHTRLRMEEAVVIPNEDFVRQPDGAILAARRTVGDPRNPSLLVEVGYSEELVSLCRSAAIYLGAGTNVQFVIAAKAWKKRRDDSRQLLYLHFDRQNLNVNPRSGLATPDLAVSFGTGALHRSTVQWLTNHGMATNLIRGFGSTDANGNPYPVCDQPEIGVYQVDVPAAAIYFGAAIPAFAPAAYTIDSFNVQESAIECDDP